MEIEDPQQSVSLYNLYKNRSYECTVDMMGCALIQPMMYFNVRNIPMFSGPYMITKVTHTISENDFQTSFTGTRQPFYSLPKIDNYFQTLNIKILSTIQSQIQKREQTLREGSDNIKFQQANIIPNLQSEDKLTKNQDCATSINPVYRNFIGTETPTLTSITAKNFFDKIKTILINRGESATGTTIQSYSLVAFTFIYVDSGKDNIISAYESNYSTINLKEVYGDSFNNYINRSYFCVNRGTDTNLPVASFKGIDTFIEFVLNRIVVVKTVI